jgi:hypothetical protein
VFKLLFLPFRIVRLLLRITGVKGGILLAIGVGVGLLVAPRKGAELRADLQARLSERTGGGAERVPADRDASL